MRPSLKRWPAAAAIAVDNGTGDPTMDKDRIIGAGKQVKGAIKEGVGKLTGDAKLQAEGRADKVEGKVQNAVGGLKDTVRDTVDKA
jgi:uncharacterized protein YjbJ (UPF0337 family)